MGHADARPLTTVVMPVHNGEPYVREAVQSILDQEFPEWCLLVVDDGSTDTTAQTLASFEDPRITVLTHPCNRGRAAAMRTGIENARTRYVGFLGADDVVLPTWLAAAVPFLESHPEVAVVSCQLALTDEHGRLTGEVRTNPEDHDDIATAMLCAPSLHHGGSVARTEVLRGVEVAPFDVAEDYDMWARLLIDGHRLANLPEVHYLYRQHSRQSVRTEREAMARAHRSVQEMLVAELWPRSGTDRGRQLARWLHWRSTDRSPTSVRDPAVMDLSLRASRWLVQDPGRLGARAAAILRRRVIDQELVAWGGVPSMRGLLSCARELTPVEFLVVARRMIRTRVRRVRSRS